MKYIVWYREKSQTGPPYLRQVFDNQEDAVAFLDIKISEGFWGVIIAFEVTL